ncbi:hypothetical protein [Paenibacillus lutrae]|uniref:Uncharacterized protein n=1 Tax=Paenibacillus lutrae TaxID=2078573 RepID=A0A7X3JZ27_9BACL|nr:hypothetical protein [Paenibacillus lutrae]MVO99574.1 hypothetical protein [Paenibacillus lutrae]
MKTAIFTSHPLKREICGESAVYSLQELLQTDLSPYGAVLLIGSPHIDEETSLTSEECAYLWNYVFEGGKLYAELINAFDFPSSRLFGWKQDFPKSRRMMEKLRYVPKEGVLQEGQLFEWDGAMAYGFSIAADTRLEIGPFKETHQSTQPLIGAKPYPGLNIRELGKGKVVFAAFSLFSSQQPAALRPYKDWAQFIAALAGDTGIPFTMWEPVMELSRGTSADEAIEKSLKWFVSSGIMPELDGSKGIWENVHSVTARISYDRRPDCHAHTALMFYLYGKASGKPEWEEASHAMLQYLFDEGYQDMDPASPSYGFFKWFDYPGEKPDQIFTDDNAWVCLVLLYLYRKTGKEEYRERGLLIAEGFLATQNANGLRANCITGKELEDLGKEKIASELAVSMNPHFESIAHTAFIQAYLVTGKQEYLDAAVKGSIYMLEHMDELKFMYSRTSGLARFLLPLGFLAAHDGSGRIQAGMQQITAYLLSNQHETGGIEEADNPDPDRFGQEDAGVYIHNGEGIADQLYTNNFLLMNAWELWKATQDETYRKLYEDLASFLSAIQISSKDARFDGGWMRALDLTRMEYFGNNGDTGWGPYCMEGGWTNAMTTAGFLLGKLDESIFD